jgi:hypothetical protein
VSAAASTLYAPTVDTEEEWDWDAGFPDRPFLVPHLRLHENVAIRQRTQPAGGGAPVAGVLAQRVAGTLFLSNLASATGASGR